MMLSGTPPLVLASQSQARFDMLRAAGVDFTARPVFLDEENLQQTLQQQGVSPYDMARRLAQAKALCVAAQITPTPVDVAQKNTVQKNTAHSTDMPMVIGADQVLCCGGRVFSKAKNKEDARIILMALRGRTHDLISAVCIARGDNIIWEHTAQAQLRMIDLSEGDIDRYCAAVEGAGLHTLTQSVGCYALEGLGAWLFDRVDGDFFTVLGLPLLPLLGFLRGQSDQASDGACNAICAVP